MNEFIKRGRAAAGDSMIHAESTLSPKLSSLVLYGGASRKFMALCHQTLLETLYLLAAYRAPPVRMIYTVDSTGSAEAGGAG